MSPTGSEAISLTRLTCCADAAIAAAALSRTPWGADATGAVPSKVICRAHSPIMIILRIVKYDAVVCVFRSCLPSGWGVLPFGRGFFAARFGAKVSAVVAQGILFA